MFARVLASFEWSIDSFTTEFDLNDSSRGGE